MLFRSRGPGMSDTTTLDQIARRAGKAKMGDFAWPTVVLGVVSTTAYIATPLLVAGGQLSVLLALPLMVLLTYASYTVLHEAVHGSISGSHGSLRWVNELMGYASAWVLMIPLTAHRHEHLAHHRNTNNPSADPDLVIADMTRSPVHTIRAAYRVVVSQYAYYIQHRWQSAPTSQNVHFCLEIAAAFLLRAAIIAQGYWLEQSIVFVLGGLGGVALLMYLFAYIVHRPHESVGRYVDTSTIVLPGLGGRLLTALWGYQNYHSIHHLFPRVPFYKYRSLFDEIEPVMVARGAPVYRLTLTGLMARSSAVAPGMS